jgi:hypothetical protein
MTVVSRVPVGATHGREDAMPRYETWEHLEDEVEVSTGLADCWTCFLDG